MSLSTKINITILILISIVLSSFNVYGQLPVSTRFINLNQDDGLRQNSVTKIIQDKYGFIWVGTPNGLYRHDGYGFESFKPKSDDSASVIANSIINLYNDSKGYIWVSTSEGLSIFNSNSQTFYTPTNLKHEKPVNCLLEGPKNTFWVGTRNGLYVFVRVKDKPILKRIFNKNPEISKYKGLPSENINRLCFDNDSNLWIGTGSGLSSLSFSSVKNICNGKDDFKFNHLNEDVIFKQLKGYFIIDMDLSIDGFIYVLKRSGLFKIKQNYCQEVILPAKNLVLRSLFLENDSTIWLGTRNTGLLKITQNETEIFEHSELNPYSISSNQVNSIYKDKSNVLWLGCARGGISKLFLNQKEYKHYFHIPKEINSLSHNQVNTVFEDKEKNIWVATYGKGLEIIRNFNSTTFFLKLSKLIPFLSKIQVFAINQDGKGNIWLGTSDHGIILISNKEISKIKKGEKPNIKIFNSFNYQDKKFALTNTPIIYQVSDTEYWIGSFNGEGLTRMLVDSKQVDNPQFKRYTSDSFSNDGILSNYIASVYKDSKGFLWVGSKEKGATRITLDLHKNPKSFFHFISNPKYGKSLTSNRIFAITEDTKGRIWMGTFGEGINILENALVDNDTSFVHVNESNGLSDNTVYGIVPDDNGFVWVSTDLGLSKINTSTLDVRNYNESDGVQRGNFRKNAYHKGESGNIYFGGIYGITKFNPDDIKTDTLAPQTIIAQIYIQGKKILPNRKYNNRIVLSEPIFESDNTIEILSSERTFQFEFLSTNFADPSFNRFEYKMEGYDEDWRLTDKGSNKVSFSNLRFGEYTFKVRALNPDGILSSNVAFVNIKILPPFYLTKIAFGLYLVLILSVFLILRRIVIIRHNLKSNLQIEQLEKQKIKEVNDLKLSFFTNISHEFRTPLTLILAPLENLINNYKHDHHVAEGLKVIQTNSKRMLKLVNQLMEFRKIEAGHLSYEPVKSDIVGFVKTLLHSFIEAANQQEVKLVFESESNYIAVKFDHDKIEKIVYNLVSNALKNTEEGGTVIVRIQKGNATNIAESNTYNVVTNHMDEFVSLSVEDTGVGIPKEQLSLIFDQFKQLNTFNNNFQTGTGIGLSMVKKFVEIHKGSLLVQSTLNTGSNFIVQLPLIKSKDGALSNNNTITEKIELTYSHSNSKHQEPKLELPKFFSDFSSENRPLLLIVEDNKDICEFLKQTFEKYFEILLAYNGKEGYDIAVSKIPELIISDIMMPLMDGIELTNELKTNTLTNHIPIILLTAKGAIEHRIESIKKGADAFIPKPFKIEHLAARMQQLLTMRNTLREKYQKESSLLPEKKSQTYSAGEMAFLQSVEKVIEENMTNSEFVVGDLESELSLSRMQLYRKLKSLVGMPANEFIRDYRLRKAAVLLCEGEFSITEIIYKTGFSNHSYFTRSFKKKFGKSPKEFANDYKN